MIHLDTLSEICEVEKEMELHFLFPTLSVQYSFRRREKWRRYSRRRSDEVTREDSARALLNRLLNYLRCIKRLYFARNELRKDWARRGERRRRIALRSKKPGGFYRFVFGAFSCFLSGIGRGMRRSGMRREEDLRKAIGISRGDERGIDICVDGSGLVASHPSRSVRNQHPD